MAKDLLNDSFGRFREIPLSLSRRGHEVNGVCLSYLHCDETELIDSDGLSAKVRWKSVNAGMLKIFGLFRYIRLVKKLIRDTDADIVWACSDSFYGIIGKWVTKKTRSIFVFDLYDNFDSYGSTSIPGVGKRYQDAIRSASGVTCVSIALKKQVTSKHRRTRSTLVLANGIRKDLFYPRDKTECRKQLGLPQDGIIIGTAGALSKSRGIQSMFDGFEYLTRENSNFHLAIAGPRDNDTIIPISENIHDLGLLPLDQVPILLCALDVAVINNIGSEFGLYCFPQKAYEIIACRIPLVAAAVGSMNELFGDQPMLLFEPENPRDFVRAVHAQLNAAHIYNGFVPTWDDLALRFENYLFQISGLQSTTQ